MNYITKTCEFCSKQFEADTREHNRGYARFCSLSCSSSSRKNKYTYERTCIYCQQVFISGYAEAKYCSKVCRMRNYRKMQKSVELSPKTLQRVLGGLPCEICGWTEATRDIHHIIPVAEGGKNLLNNLIVVCPNHHRMMHRNLVPNNLIQDAISLRLSNHPELNSDVVEVGKSESPSYLNNQT